jgi:hypothetical protein
VPDDDWNSDVNLAARINPLKEQLDKVTRVACELYTVLPLDVKLSKDAWEWITQQQKGE